MGSIILWQDQSMAPQLLAGQSGLYWVQVTIDGCSSRDSIRINALEKPHVDLGADGFICEGQPVLLSVNDPGVSLVWQDGSTASSYLAQQEGLYYVTASNSCGSYSDSIRLLKGNCLLRVPNAFTPNGDGRNDLFRILGTQTLVAFKLRIFNRWGQLVYESSDKNSGWDGNIHGKAAESGTYVYLLQFRDATQDRTQNLRGTILLIR